VKTPPDICSKRVVKTPFSHNDYLRLFSSQNTISWGRWMGMAPQIGEEPGKAKTAELKAGKTSGAYGSKPKSSVFELEPLTLSRMSCVGLAAMISPEQTSGGTNPAAHFRLKNPAQQGTRSASASHHPARPGRLSPLAGLECVGGLKGAESDGAFNRQKLRKEAESES
jgi:hypothetical protein